MKQAESTSLSEHLLNEADRFLLYPQRVRRARSNLRIQKELDKVWRRLAEWRKTFEPPPSDRIKKLVPQPARHSTQILDEYPAFLNELYCRDLLKLVPGIVERTLKLSHVTFSGISDSEFVYLREAVNCYLFDLPRAAIALARAALEDCLRKKLARTLGKKTAAELRLKGLIGELAKTKGVSIEARAQAHRVRVAGDGVLHNLATASSDAIDVIEDARALILEIYGRGLR